MSDDTNSTMVKLYDWREFFSKVAGKLCEIGKDKTSRNAEIIDRAQKVFGEDHPIVNSEYLDKGGVDPFSFIYSLSQPPASHVPTFRYLEHANGALVLNSKAFPFDSFEYPHATPQNSLFHAGGSYVAGEKENPPREKTDGNLNEIWALFLRIYGATKYDDIDNESFKNALRRPGFGLANLTHVMFLINPDVFLPIDARTLWLPLGAAWSEEGYGTVWDKIKVDTYTFHAIMASFMKAFPGCRPYEINLFAYSLQANKLLLNHLATGDEWTDHTWKISSNRYNEGIDYWEDKDGAFRPNSWVHVGERSGDENTEEYPYAEPKEGDYMIVRMGGLVHGLGVVLQNYYTQDKWSDDDYINVVWVHIEDRERAIPNRAKAALSRHHKGISVYHDVSVYPETETLLQAIIEKQGRPKHKYSEYINLLEANKNLILTGAPGTGKTYIAKELAAYFLSVTRNELADKAGTQYAFVQFHPSYDYTDFVEGLRPTKEKGKNEIGFERRDGTFKAFCKRAMDEPSRKHVFVIDEINRGEISKIFGELFFSIDPSYRGDAGTVTTQYANMDKEAEGAGKFYVPENVYIIGTMNDIDRSVESFDFAMRRRFAWKEVRYTDTLGMLSKLGDDQKEAEQRLKGLNNAIRSGGNAGTGIEGLSAAYHIGPAYFLKVAKYQEDADKWDMLWDYHLAPLLREYLRTLPEAEKRLGELKNAYTGNK